MVEEEDGVGGVGGGDGAIKYHPLLKDLKMDTSENVSEVKTWTYEHTL